MSGLATARQRPCTALATGAGTEVPRPPRRRVLLAIVPGGTLAATLAALPDDFEADAETAHPPGGTLAAFERHCGNLTAETAGGTLAAILAALPDDPEADAETAHPPGGPVAAILAAMRARVPPAILRRVERGRL